MNTPLSLLLVEDHDDVRNSISSLLSAHQDFRCRTAADAETAKDVLERRTFDVVIMDINLHGQQQRPNMDGIALTRYVRERYLTTQVLIYTVHEDDERIFNALKAGATGYILKRAVVPELMEAIRQIHRGESPMTGSIARRVVASFGTSASDAEARLSEREQEVLDLLSQGMRAKDIAEKLFLSIATVQSHIRHIYDKLHVRNRVDMLRKTGRLKGT